MACSSFDLEQRLDAPVVALLLSELDGLFERLVERRVELEHLVVEVERDVDVAELARADDRGGVQVLGLLLRVVDEVRELEDDLDQLVPVLFLAVELHQLGEDVAVVGPLVERGDVALGGARAILELGREDLADLEEQRVALVAVGDVEPPALHLDDVLPVA